MYREIEGDLIKLALEGNFDVITHGCNCFCTMGAGIAPQMAIAFGADKFPLEHGRHRGNYNKLGTVDPVKVNGITIINSYTQYGFGANHENGEKQPINYTALAMCLEKINFQYKGKRVGLPQIGCGLAGGDWTVVKSIILDRLKDCEVTVVFYKK